MSSGGLTRPRLTSSQPTQLAASRRARAMGSAAAGHGIALLRLDRAADALSRGDLQRLVSRLSRKTRIIVHS